MKRRWMRVIIVLLFFFLLYFQAAKNDMLADEFQEEIRGCLADGDLPIVLLAQESGSYAYVGAPALWSAEYAVKKINENGGVNGCQVRLVIGNTNSDKGRALSLFQGAQREALVVLGPVDAPETVYIADNTEHMRSVHLAAYSYEQARQEAVPYRISYMSDSEDGELEAVSIWAAQNTDIRKVVIFTMSEDASKENSTRLLQEKLPGLGLEIVDIVDVKMNAKDSDYQKYAIRALNACADGYIFLLSGEDYAHILTELRRHGVEEGYRISTSFSSYLNETMEIAGEALDGTYIWNKFDPDYQGEEWQELNAAYQESLYKNALIGNPVLDYYDAVQAICRCYETFGITSDNYQSFLGDEKILEWFYNSNDQQGIQGKFCWQQGKKVMDYQFFVFQGRNPVNQKNLHETYQN